MSSTSGWFVLGSLTSLALPLPLHQRLALTLATGLWLWLSLSPQERHPRVFGAQQALIHLVLMAVVVLLYAPVLISDWLHDDPVILRHYLQYGIWQNFTDPETWRIFSPFNLTPWLIASFGGDVLLFGTRSPTGFYLHQLLLTILLTLVGHRLLRPLLTPATAVLIPLLLVFSVPIATVTQQLMTRHYLEGLLLTFLATAAFVRAVTTRHRGYSALSAVGYALACTAKEIYVPLPLLLALLPVAGIRQRLGTLKWLLPVLVAYPAWRFYMLRPANTLSGSGSFYAPPWDDPGALIHLFSNPLGWSLLLGGLFTALMASVLIMETWQRRWAWLVFWIGMAGLIVLPIVPVFVIASHRTVLLLALYAALLAGIALERLAQNPGYGIPSATVLGLSLLIASALAISRSDEWGDREHIARYQAENAFIMGGPAIATLITPLGPADHYEDLAWLRRWQDEGESPALCYDPCLCPDTLFPVTYGEHGLQALTLSPDGCHQRLAPLEVSLRYDQQQGIIHWQLQANEASQWLLVNDRNQETLPLSPAGSMPFQLREPLRFRVGYQSPAGWRTFTPPLSLALPDQTAAHYRRE